jgi:hypothetical protein
LADSKWNAWQWRYVLFLEFLYRIVILLLSCHPLVTRFPDKLS